MMVTVNGDPLEVDEGTTAEDLVRMLGLRPDRTAVEIDGEVCPRAARHSHRLREGQYVEIVGFVGGGR